MKVKEMNEREWKREEKHESEKERGLKKGREM